MEPSSIACITKVDILTINVTKSCLFHAQRTTISIATSRLSFSTSPIIFDSKSLANNLYAASAVGDLEHMKLLISLGAPVNAATDVHGLYESFKPAKSGFLSALAGAASSGRVEAAAYLISQGAHIIPDIHTSSNSPLQQACRANDVAMARYLLDNGADVEEVNCYKSTPLMYAVKYGSTDLVRLILSYRPSLDTLSFMRSTAIHWTLWPPRLDVLELLLRAGANPDDSLEDESTLLHCASMKGWVEGIKLLVRFGADPFKKNADWQTALDVALINKHDDAAVVLEAAMLLAS